MIGIDIVIDIVIDILVSSPRTIDADVARFMGPWFGVLVPSSPGTICVWIRIAPLFAIAVFPTPAATM